MRVRKKKADSLADPPLSLRAFRSFTSTTRSCINVIPGRPSRVEAGQSRGGGPAASNQSKWRVFILRDARALSGIEMYRLKAG